MTALEAFLNQPGRDDRIVEVRSLIDRLGVKMIYFQYISVTGRVVGKAVPVAHWESLAHKGVQTVYAAITNAIADRHGNYIGWGPGQTELLALPEPETFCQLPWNKSFGRVFCTVFHNREDLEQAGEFFTADCWGNLRRIEDQFKKDHGGLHLRLGCEPEMLWLNRGPDGKPAGGVTEPYAYHINSFEAISDIVLQVHEYAGAMGFDMIQADHEDAPDQLEQNWRFDDCFRTADRLTTYRQLCAQVAREKDLIACFMTKLYDGVSANGCHHNMSLWRSGEDRANPLGFDPVPAMGQVFSYCEGGKNVYASDGDDWRPSPLGLNCIAGIVKHLPGMTAIGSTTVNSYRRMMDVGFWTPVYADWGLQNRTCALRISSADRMEYRAIDSMVNPYLMGAALYKAIDDGLKNDLDAGKPEQRNVYELREEGKPVLPLTLGDALNALDADDVIKSAMPGDMYRIFQVYKTDEWERLNATITEWDIDTYIDCLP